MQNKLIYFFKEGKADGSANMKEILGGKGANLAEMSNLGLPVPPGFTISTEACIYYQKYNKMPDGLDNEIISSIKKVESIMGLEFGNPDKPLLFSVRSGARASMPGMMDTVLNIGLNDEITESLAKITGNRRFAYDSYRRLIQMFSDVVLGIKEDEYGYSPFEKVLEKYKEKRNIKYDTEFTADDWLSIIKEYKEIVKKRLKREFPQDHYEQLFEAIKAVFRSWNNERAKTYRRLNNIPDNWGTAVNVQAMVFGNKGENSGTGVAFTRNPATGENTFYGEFLQNAQGEDVVAGIRTPLPISDMKKIFPEPYEKLLSIRDILEKHYKDMQDIEFTIEEGKLWMLQTRSAKRTGFSAIVIAVDMVNENLITPQQAILRIEPEQLNDLLRPRFDINSKKQAIKEGKLLAKGLPAGPGAASGIIAFSADRAVFMADKMKKEALKSKTKPEDIILVRIETSPDDVHGINAAAGILTARGGMTSHAALVSRQMGKIAIVGCQDLQIDYANKEMKIKNKIFKEGDFISIDGTTGEVIEGKLKTEPSEVVSVLIHKTLKPEDAKIYQYYNKIIQWANEFRRLKVRANADQPEQARIAVAFGAEGIGLCRTEHMFFGDPVSDPEGKRILAFRKMIFSKTREERIKALQTLLPMQRDDFIGIFKIMQDRPVTIRTLDPPLHEFLPKTKEEKEILAKALSKTIQEIEKTEIDLEEANPMLGHRGCRLGITYPEITEMQARAIFESACIVKKEGIDVKPEIMIPLTSDVKELAHQEQIIRNVADEVFKSQNIKVDYSVGTMIELPRSALLADEIAQIAEFFSFGTNDLTQTTYGISRDDSGKFLPVYIKENIWKSDPFEKLDRKGVGKLMKIAVENGRKARIELKEKLSNNKEINYELYPSDLNPNKIKVPDNIKELKVGICGEHGGEPSSVEFCHNIGLDYVSCSPFRIPVAILASAQASLKEKK